MVLVLIIHVINNSRAAGKITVGLCIRRERDEYREERETISHLASSRIISAKFIER